MHYLSVHRINLQNRRKPYMTITCQVRDIHILLYNFARAL